MPTRLFALCLFGAALALAAVPARADRDAVQFFGNIDVTADTPVHDAVCFFCNVHVDSDAEIKHDTVVFFGNIHLQGHADHDVVSFFGNVVASDNSTIGGDLVSFFGTLRLGENVTVGKDMVAMFGIIHSPASVSVGKDRVVFSPWIIAGPFLVIFAVIFLIVHEVRVHRQRQFMQNYPLPPPPRV